MVKHEEMIVDSKVYKLNQREDTVGFLSEEECARLNIADANPRIRMGFVDKRIPFIVLADGGVIADTNANNPKTIADNFKESIAAENLYYGAGFIDVHHGNRTLVFRHMASALFSRKWHVIDVAGELQAELDLYYPGYRVRGF
ncbi:hypothetical protein [uncultured Mucilaginibacter sp.]|uniref:hypothetical protein n=1 Tax=uncultured Mucilaginibacter sp. TaxID=797541 RepID=UPI0025D167F1|nr:hypothetical protein [uncultured Mucilaginibacter sp.]